MAALGTQNVVSLAIEQGQTVLFAGYGLIGLAIFLVARMLILDKETRLAQESLEESRDRKASNGFIKLLRPLISQYIVPRVRGKKAWDEKRKYFRRRVITAGLAEELTADEVIALKLFLVVFMPLFGIFLKKGDFIDLEWYIIAIFPVAGWFVPNLWINSRRESRQKSILKTLPFVVDLLALSTEAGLDFVGAIGKVVEKSTPAPLIDELTQLLKEMKLGSSRAAALREMAGRVDMTEMNSFVSIIIASDQAGAPIGKILRQQSEAIRNDRMVRAEKAGAAAAQKILIPLMLFIVPAVLIMVMGPFFLSWMNGGGANQ